MEEKFIFNAYTQTIRKMPENYWVASVVNGDVIFNSWDGSTKLLFKNGTISENEIISFYNKQKLKL